MIPRPPRSTRTDTLVPYTPLFRSGLAVERRVNVAEVLGVGGVRQTPGTDVRLVSHRDLPDRAGGRCSFAAACVPVANDCSLDLTRRSLRSEESRVGHERVRTCRSRWSPYLYKKKL